LPLAEYNSAIPGNVSDGPTRRSDVRASHPGQRLLAATS